MAKNELIQSYRKRLLGSSDLFGVLTHEQVDELLDRSKVVEFKSNEEIFHQGDQPDQLYIVLSGRVAILMRSNDGKEAIVRLIEAGESLGEIAILDGQPRTATARAESSKTQLLRIDREEVESFLTSTPDAMLRLLKLMAERLRLTTESLEDMLFLPLQQRIAKLLLGLASRYGVDTDSGVRIDVKLPQRVVAEMVGATRESVNMQMLEWDKAEILQRSRGSITILDIEALDQVASAQIK